MILLRYAITDGYCMQTFLCAALRLKLYLHISSDENGVTSFAKEMIVLHNEKEKSQTT